MDKQAKREVSNKIVRQILEETSGIAFMEFEEIHILSKLPTIDNEDQIHPVSETATKVSMSF